MKSVIMLIGLPGSGKTTFGKAMEKGNDTTKFVDDISHIKQLPSTFWNKIAISDVNFCDPEIEKKAYDILKKRYRDYRIDRVYFRNDVETCLHNIKFRDDGRNVIGTVDRFKDVYKVPDQDVYDNVEGIIIVLRVVRAA